MDKRKNESKVGTSKQYNSGYDAAKSSIKSENDILYSVKDIKDLAKDFGIEGKDADKFVKGYQAYTDEWYDCHDSMDEDVKTKAKKLLKALDENALTNDELIVKILTPDGYFDEYGNPNGEINGMEDRLQEIDEIFKNVGAETKWDVHSDPEAGIEGDDFQDTGYRFVTVAQLKAALDAGVDESEIAVYTKLKDEDEYTDEDWNHVNNPYDDSDYDPNDEYRIYDVLSLVYDADEPMAEAPMTEAKSKLRSGWKQYIDNSDPLARRESLKWLYDKCSWEYLDDFDDDRYNADADYDRDGNTLNRQDLIDCLTEVNWCFSGVSDLADFLRECSRENLPKARDRIVHLNKLLGIK